MNQNKKIKNSVKIKFLLAAAPVVVLLLFFLVLIVAFLSPILMFMGGTVDTTNRSKKTFTNAILNKEEEWNKKGVQIDKELILSVLLYGRGYNYSGGYVFECDSDDIDSCIADNNDKMNNNGKLIKYAKQLADGMVKSVTEYSCQNKIVKQITVCEEEISFQMLNKNRMFPFLQLIPDTPLNGGSTTCKNPVVREEISYGVERYCGVGDSSLCDNVCEAGYKLNDETKYELKTTDEYIDFLKNDYKLYNKLEELELGGASTEEKKKEIVDKAIANIYDMYHLALSSQSNSTSGIFPSLVYTSGSFQGNIYAWNQCGVELNNVLLPYGSGKTYCSSGCGLAATAAIISSLSGTEINPVKIGSNYCTSNLCTSDGTFGFEIAKIAAKEHGFDCSSQFSGNDSVMMQGLVEKLASGNSMVMVRVGPGTISSGTHFIVLTGVNEDGTVTMVDSGRPANNNRSWTLQEVAENAKPGGFMIISR